MGSLLEPTDLYIIIDNEVLRLAEEI